MTGTVAVGPVTLLGHGRLGSAMSEGWGLTGAVAVADLSILTRDVPAVCPAGTCVLVIAVKPGVWREAVAPLTPSLPENATVLSVMAGVRAGDISRVFPGRPVVRVMPTTAVAQAQGVAAIWSAYAEARAVAHALFDPIASTVDLDDEAQMDAATAVAGSAPAFVYAFTRALVAAGVEAGLDEDAASRLARGALRSAGAGVGTGDTLDALIARITSPGGTTQAGLEAMETAGLTQVATAAVQGAVARAKGLAGDEPA